MNFNELEDTIRGYCDAGLAIFPVDMRGNRKSPLCDNGYKDASNEYSRVLALFKEPINKGISVYDIGIGLPTGLVNDLFVIDVDKKDGSEGFVNGFINFYDFCIDNNIEIPTEAHQETVSGGYHYFYKYSNDCDFRCSAGKIAPGVDVRSDGGYVVVSPTRGYKTIRPFYKLYNPSHELVSILNNLTTKHTSKRDNLRIYEWDLRAVATFLGVDCKDKETHKITNLEIPCIHTNTNRGGFLLDFQTNSFKCFSCDVYGSAVDLVHNYLKARNRDSTSFRYMCSTASGPEFLNALKVMKEEIKDKEEEEKKEKLGFSLSYEEVLASPPPPEPIIEDRILIEGGFFMLAGEPKTGKTNFVLNLAMSLASGLPFLDKYKVNKKNRVFILQCEIDNEYMMEKIRDLINDFPDKWGEEKINQYKESLPNIYISHAYDKTLNEKEVTRLIDIINQEFPMPDVVIIDPIRNLMEGEEVSNKDMMDFCRLVKNFVKRINPKACVICVHHTKKMSKGLAAKDPFNSYSGASALRGYYTSGALLIRSDNNLINLFIESRYSKDRLPVITLAKRGLFFYPIDFDGIAVNGKSLIDARALERNRKMKKIIDLLRTNAKKGKYFAQRSFATYFASKHDLGGRATIEKLVKEMLGKGYLKYFDSHNGEIIWRLKGHGFLCCDDMLDPDRQIIRPNKEVNMLTGEVNIIEYNNKWHDQDSLFH